nr:prolyl 4-hydroxylase subunit alpha-1-like [Halyomorpha halys]
MKLTLLWNLMMLFCSASTDLYSSVVGLEKLLQTESSIIQIYQSFMSKTEQQIAELKRQIEKLEKEHEKTTRYLSDPFSSFHLVRRILIEWSSVENVLSDSLIQEVKSKMTELKSSTDFPSEQDLTGSSDAINLISDTYNIEITSLANGIINGIQYPSQLSANDCYAMGVQSYIKNDFYRAYSWMDEALERFCKERNPANPDIIETSLGIKAYSAYQLGDLTGALNITIELLKYYPNNTHAPGNIEYYTYMLNRKEVPKTERIIG